MKPSARDGASGRATGNHRRKPKNIYPGGGVNHKWPVFYTYWPAFILNLVLAKIGGTTAKKFNGLNAIFGL
jgi:hypothetical protein